MAGIEPATDGLRNRCSTAELHWHLTLEKSNKPKHFKRFDNVDSFYHRGCEMQENAAMRSRMNRFEQIVRE